MEAGLPPRVQVLDDIASQLAFEERWTRFVDELLDDPTLERTILLALNADTTLTVLRTLALACNANWDLVAERMHEEPDPPPLAPALAPVLGAFDEIPGLAAHCLADDDKLLAGLQRLDHVARGAARRPRRVRAAATPHPGRPEGRRDPREEGQLARRLSGRRRPAEGEGAARAGRHDRRPPHRGGGAAAGVGVGAVHPARGRGAPGRRRTRVPRPARAGPLDAARRRARVGGAPTAARPLHPPVARRVPGHRPDPVRPRRAAGVG